MRAFIAVAAVVLCGMAPAWARVKSDQEITATQQIAFIQSEIDHIRQDLDWLSRRIRKFEAFHGFVPEKMIASRDYKQNKIKILTALKNEWTVLPRKGKQPAAEKKNISVKGRLPTQKTNAGGNPCGETGIMERIRRYGIADWLDRVSDPKGVRFENRLPILFASGSAEVAQEYRPFLKNVAMVLKECKIKVLADGYADTDPIRTEKYPSNYELGAARAAAVVRVLIQHGVSPEIFKIGTTGQFRLPEHRSAKWKALDRHVNLTLLPQP